MMTPPATSHDTVVFDTETTGLSTEDRVVSLGAVRLGPDLAPKGSLHLVFNPGRRSHLGALRVHGLSDQYLSFQPRFAEHLDEVAAFFRGAALAAHNLDFDTRMLGRELALCGAAPLPPGGHCTMRAWRERTGAGRAGLDAVLGAVGLRRQGQMHGALEDAVLAAGVLRWMSGLPATLGLTLHAPANERPLPPTRAQARPRAPRPAPSPGGHPLAGRRVVLTGELDSLSREAAAERLLACGARRQSAVNGLTDYVVAGAMPGPAKLRTVRALQAAGGGPRLLGEAEFLAMLGG